MSPSEATTKFPEGKEARLKKLGGQFGTPRGMRFG